MNIIIANFGDDSIALIEWAYQNNLSSTVILSVDTGWKSEYWNKRLEKVDTWLSRINIKHYRLKSEFSFTEVVKAKKQFPSQKFNWCISFLKGTTIMKWLDQYDENITATILLAHQRRMTKSLFDLQEYNKESNSFDGRIIRYPLFDISLDTRDKLIGKTPFKKPLNHRSLECQPCIYFSYNDLKTVTKNDYKKINTLELEINNHMFNDKSFTEISNFLEKEVNYYDELSNTCNWDYSCGL